MKTQCHTPPCPLCGSPAVEPFFEDAQRAYLRCSDCELVFVPRRYWLGVKEEKATYDLHQNDAHDPGYRRFLSRLSVPLLGRLDTRRRGLDFGCGPGPTLSVLLEAGGHRVDLYDPLYCRDSSVFKNTYDFITASEVVEHLREPGREFTAMFKMLKPGGWLGIMTKLVIDRSAFGRWHYIRDPTHVGFYCRRTFEYIARRFMVDLTFVGDDVILLKKK